MNVEEFFIYFINTASPITASVSSLQPPPTVEYLGNGRLCINCSFSGPSVNACVVIVHSTHNTSNLLGKQLKVFSIERNVAYDCLEVDEDEYHVAVFGLLRDYLENVPAIKTIIRVRNISKEIPTTGQCSVQILSDHDVVVKPNIDNRAVFVYNSTMKRL